MFKRLVSILILLSFVVIPALASPLMLMNCGLTAISSAPDSPVAGYTLWYDANQESYANNDSVGTITDRSGNGYNATVAGAARPLFKTGIQNGNPAYLFDGTDDYSVTSSVLPSVISNSAYSVFIVYNVTSIDTDNPSTYQNDGLISGPNGGGYFGVHLKSTGPKVCAYNWDTNDDHVDITTVTGAAQIVHVRHESGNLYASVNGGSESSTASGNTGDTGGVIEVGKGIGATYLNGYIMEILIYNTALSTASITANHAYLNGKYMIY